MRDLDSDDLDEEKTQISKRPEAFNENGTDTLLFTFFGPTGAELGAYESTDSALAFIAYCAETGFPGNGAVEPAYQSVTFLTRDLHVAITDESEGPPEDEAPDTGPSVERLKRADLRLDRLRAEFRSYVNMTAEELAAAPKTVEEVRKEYKRALTEWYRVMMQGMMGPYTSPK